MTRRRRLALSLEQLEDRMVPATVQFIPSNGTLLISPSPGEAALNLTVTQSSANKFTVVDNGKTIGSYGPTVSNVIITGGSGADSITIDLAAKTYTGNLLISSGTGNDTLTILSAGGAGSIGGNTTLTSGSGVDSVNLNSTGTTAVAFGGSVQVTGTGGQETVNFGNNTAVTTVGRGLTITGASAVNLGVNGALAGPGQPDVISGGLTIQDGALVVGTSILVNTGTTVTGAGRFTINGNVNVTTGAGNDTVSLGVVTVNGGSTNVNEGSGVDLAIFGQYLSSPTELGANFNGNLSVSHTTGTFGVQFAFPDVISGNVNVQLGNGGVGVAGNSVSVDLPVGTGFLVFGNLTITAGNGDNNVSPFSTVFGNVNITLGNSATNNVTTFFNAPVGGTFNYTSGNGADELILAPGPGSATNWNANIQFGTGSDTVILDGVGGILTGRLTSQLPGSNLLINVGWTFGSPFYYNF